MTRTQNPHFANPVLRFGGEQKQTLPGGGFHGGEQKQTLPGGGFHCAK